MSDENVPAHSVQISVGSDSTIRAELVDRVEALEAAIADLKDARAEFLRVLQSHQAGIDQLTKIVPPDPSLIPIAFETAVALSITALNDLSGIAADTTRNETADLEIDRTIQFNERALRAMEWQAARRASSGDASRVIVIARAAADWAASHHPGRFLSPELEETLRNAGRTVVKNLDPWRGGSGNRVLHVMTSASDVGGHTRLVDRWIRFDIKREHSVVLTEQENNKVPKWLAEHAAGGISVLEGGTQSGRVQELCARMTDFDYAVLHIHPYDAVVVAACADPNRRPPTIVVDTSDHRFWLGIGIADTVVSLRPAAAALNRERRGLEGERSAVLPLPLDAPARDLEPREAKAAIGIDPDGLLMVSIAPEWKFTPHFDLDFASLVGSVLDEVPSAHVVLIGADPSETRWIDLTNRHRPRVRILAPSQHTKVYLEAADIYLDSIPLPSMTSALEGALMGIPSVTLSSPQLSYLGARDFGFGSDGLTRYSTAEEWREGVVGLLRDRDLREREAMRTLTIVERHHMPTVWEPALDTIYANAKVRGWPRLPRIPMRFDQLDRALASFQDVSMPGRSLETLLAAYDLLPRSLT